MCSTAFSIRGLKSMSEQRGALGPVEAGTRVRGAASARTPVAMRAPRGERGAWWRFFRRPFTRFWLAVLALVVLAAIVGPVLLPASYRELTKNQFAPPSLAHPFGTDLNGRDVLYRVLEGARVSLSVGAAGALISLFVGTAYGLVAGYAGGRTDAAMMRAVEILYSIPRLIIILIFINAFDTH